MAATAANLHGSIESPVKAGAACLWGNTRTGFQATGMPAHPGERHKLS